MLPRINPTKTKAWEKLNNHFEQICDRHMVALFKEDPDRYKRFSRQAGDLHLDFSKNRITAETFGLLMDLARECKLSDAIQSLFAGQRINETEDRAVFHMALRNLRNEPMFVDGRDVMPQVKSVRDQMRDFCQKLHSGSWLGFSGKRITDVVNIGIGGSDLGPVMATEALRPYWDKGIKAHFVSNVDGSHIAQTLEELNPETTLFLVASKTFTTQETMTNAHSARRWFLKTAGDEKHIALHFAAMSTNEKAVNDFGIDSQNIFHFWDWVGGRLSLWSSIGLSVALTVGYDRFEQMLAGGQAMDDHFRNTRPEDNLPVIMAMLGVWYNNFFKAESHAILPYDQYLHRFAAFFQQGDMECNGKRVDRSGREVNYQTGPIIWGEPGTNGQHAFYQLIHQGTKLIPSDFLAPAVPQHPIGDHHLKLLSNFFAQPEALMNGKNADMVMREFEGSGMSAEHMKSLQPFKVFPGNVPTNTLLFKKLDPYTLGMLVALYEFKIFTQGIVWNLFSFDQWGVELGKQLAGGILPELEHEGHIDAHDSSTNGLINLYKKLRNSIDN